MAVTSGYPITCSCGCKTEVKNSQAGMELQCRCGKSFSVPNLSELRRLHHEMEPVSGLQSETVEKDRLTEGLIGIALILASNVIFATLIMSPPNESVSGATIAIISFASIAFSCIGTGLLARMRQLPFWAGMLLGWLGIVGLLVIFSWRGRHK